MQRRVQILMLIVPATIFLFESQLCIANQQADPLLVGKWKLVKFNGIDARGKMIFEFYEDGRLVITEDEREITGTYLTAKIKSVKRITLKANVKGEESEQERAEVSTGKYKFVKGKLIIKIKGEPTPFFFFSLSVNALMELERLSMPIKQC